MREIHKVLATVPYREDKRKILEEAFTPVSYTHLKDLQTKLPEGVWSVESNATSDHGIEAYMRSLGKSSFSNPRAVPSSL